MSMAILMENYRQLEAELQKTQIHAAELSTAAARAIAEQQQAVTRLAEVEAELADARGRIEEALGAAVDLDDEFEHREPSSLRLIECTDCILAALKGPA